MTYELNTKAPQKGTCGHLNGVQVVGGSNPLTPTIQNIDFVNDFVSKIILMIYDHENENNF
jgi:hypothetical protein